MRSSTQRVTYKLSDTESTSADITVILHETKKEYNAAWDAAKVPLVWYEKLGFRARAFSDGIIHTSVLEPKLVGHEMLHKFGVHHPDDFFGSMKHVFKCGFGIASFTGIFRWRDNERILPRAERFISRMKRVR